MPTLEERIKKGVKALNEHTTNWHNKIDLPELDLPNPHYCILGQVYGEYSIGLHELFGMCGGCQPSAETIGAEHGFAASHKIDMTMEDEYLELEELWIQTIKDLRETHHEIHKQNPQKTMDKRTSPARSTL